MTSLLLNWRLSYSRIDASFAAALEIELERYIPPRGAGLTRQHLKVFRDQNDMIGPEYHTSVEYHLNNGGITNFRNLLKKAVILLKSAVGAIPALGSALQELNDFVIERLEDLRQNP